MDICQRSISCRLVFFKSFAPKIAAPYGMVQTSALHEEADRYALLDVENVFVFRAVGRALLSLGVSVQVKNVDLLETAHQRLAHAPKGGIIEPRVIADNTYNPLF